MRILQINSARTIGGGERHLVDLVGGLLKRECEVYLAVAPGSPIINSLPTFSRSRLIELPLRNSLDMISAEKLRRVTAQVKPDIIHAHLARDYSLAAYAALGYSPTKLIFTRHLTFPLNRLHALTIKRATAIIAVSNGVKRGLEQQRFIPHGKIKLVLNGIDVERFAQAAANVAKREQTRNDWSKTARLFVGIIGELRPHKGVDLFLRAAANLVLQSETMDFIVAGIDPTLDQSNLKRLQQFVIDNNLVNRVHFLGWTQTPEQVFAALDVFVSAAESEPFGLVIAEAMASYLAIVATDTDGAKDLIKHNETGMIVGIGNQEMLAEAIEKLAKQQSSRRALGTQAQAFAVEHLSLARMVDETLQVYQQ